MIKYLLDTDTVSYLMKKNHPFHQGILQNLLKQQEGSVAISVISVAEIARGLEKIKNSSSSNVSSSNLHKTFENIISSMIVLEFNEEAALMYGKVRTEVMGSGNDIGAMDSLIAAHALNENLVLVTNNTKHFLQVSGLKLENWCK